VEEDAFAEMEDVGEGSGGVPGLGEVGMEIHFGVAFDEAVEEESGEALGLRVGAEAGIEVGGIGFNDESQGGGIKRCRAGAGGEKKNGEEKRDGNTEFTLREERWASRDRNTNDTENGAEKRRNDGGG